MDKETTLFLEGNKKALLKAYTDYLESMVESGGYDEIEDFCTWVGAELMVATAYKKNGTPMAEYEL